MHKRIVVIRFFICTIIFVVSVVSLLSLLCTNSFAAKASNYAAGPPFATAGSPPLVMLVMGRDHKLYYEAYNDASDLDGDGDLDVGYDPTIDYYGYFDSKKYYSYNSSKSRFEPAGMTSDKKAPSGDYWSGDFLNYLTMSRIDTIRKVLYGGYRSIDTATETELERAYIPKDSHCWGKEYAGVATDGYDIADYTPFSTPTSGNRHLFASGNLSEGTPLLRVKLNSSDHIWKWVSAESGTNIMGDTLVGTPDHDYTVRVQVCVTDLIDISCEQKYTDSTGDEDVVVYKPVGLLQNYGETDRMHFGLMSGSYKNHLSGGVLRKNIGSIKDEINPNTGEFVYKDDSAFGGIIKTIDKFKIIGFSGRRWDKTIYNRPINQGENYMWGNPIAEIMYESLRYFAGETPTPEFISDISNNNDRGLQLPFETTWDDPFGGDYYCAQPVMLVISDINPSYDTDQLPGVDTNFSSSFSGTLGTMNVKTLADTISDLELSGGNHFIGQSGSVFDTACSEKTVSGFGSIRGLCPEEPTKKGGYYSAAVSYYGRINHISSNTKAKAKPLTYSVALASPLPQISIPMGGGNTITLVPMAKTIHSGSNGGISPERGTFQPTSALVDFYVEDIQPTEGTFKVVYEHAEQGSDYDMDAIIEYKYVKVSDDSIEVSISSVDSPNGGSSKQHFGYTISGTTADGVYLEIKNASQSDSADPKYYLDTPGDCGPNTGEYDDCWLGGSAPCPPGAGRDNACWKTRTNLPNQRSRTFTVNTSSSSASLLKNPLWYASKWGAFKDDPTSLINKPDLQKEWDADADGVPDTYFYVQNPLYLEAQLEKAFNAILGETSSGTAASVVSQSRSGEGAVYQSIFHPRYQDDLGNKVNWVGSLHALFVDSYGNMREDSNGNQTLDIEAAEGAEDSASNPSTDRVIVFNDVIVEKYKLAQEGLLPSDAVPEYTGTIEDINFLWRATDWLNELSDSEVTSQRIYDSATNNRYIFTFIDNNLGTDDTTDINMVVDSSAEILGFEYLSASDDDLTDVTKIFPYLNLFPTFGDEPTIDGVSIADFRNRTDFKDFLKKQSERLINYIRGEDQDEYTSTYTLPAFRSRQADYDGDGIAETWRLGDIVYSTPTVVGSPAENYHLLYGDQSYVKFLSRFKNRRQVVYAGSNDGLFHAFNGGFYDSENKKFEINGDTDGNGTDDAVAYALGSELWAYIPYNLLPHLYWLTEEGYGEGENHVYYNDLQPKVFDAKILPKNTYYIDNDSDTNWGTFLVGGMRLGGGRIIADMDKTDGSLPLMEDQNGNGILDAGEDINENGVLDQVDRIMTSAYYIFDITDPEQAPKLIAEISLNQMGYTLCNPTVVPMKSKDSNTPNEWYLVFGSGPADENGYAAGHFIDTSAGVLSASSALSEVISEQAGKLFVIDLKALVGGGETKVLQVLDGDGNFQPITGATGTHYYQSLDENAMISDPVTADYDLDFSADAVYFGTVEGDSDGWGGKMRRIVIDNDADTTTWDGDSVLFDTSTRTDLPVDQLGQPISSEANVAIDDNGRMWVYFGTGRYYTDADDALDSQETFYGIVEPFNDEPGLAEEDAEKESGYQKKEIDEPFLWTEVSDSTTTLLDVSSVEIRDDKSLTVKSATDVSGINDLDDPSNGLDWNDLIGTVDTFTTYGGGWMMDFRLDSGTSGFVQRALGERNLSQAAIFGGVVTFSTFTPSGSVCTYGGSSNLYALYYKTGTSYYESIVGFSHDDTSGETTGVVETGEMVMKKMLSLGKGLSGTPNIHSGEDEGTKAYVQTSTGDIITIKQLNPGIISSGVTTWQEGTEECQ